MNILDNVKSIFNKNFKLKKKFSFDYLRVLKENDEDKMSPKSEEIKNEESSYVHIDIIVFFLWIFFF
jgi:hypothetical protein